MGYTTNDPFRKYSIKSQSFGTPFYLTTEERDKLYKTDLRSDPKVQMARNMVESFNNYCLPRLL